MGQLGCDFGACFGVVSFGKFIVFLLIWMLFNVFFSWAKAILNWLSFDFGYIDFGFELEEVIGG